MYINLIVLSTMDKETNKYGYLMLNQDRDYAKRFLAKMQKGNDRLQLQNEFNNMLDTIKSKHSKK